MEQSIQAQVFSDDGVIPGLPLSSFVDLNAVLIGDVAIGANCDIGPNAALRGDMAAIEIGEGSNIQDKCALHYMTEIPTFVGTWEHIGHGAAVHIAQLDTNVLIGMNAVVMDELFVGKNSVVAATGFIKIGQHILEKSFFAEIPARIVRELTDEKIEWKRGSTRCYHEIVEHCKTIFERVELEPLVKKEQTARLLKSRYFQRIDKAHLEDRINKLKVIKE